MKFATKTWLLSATGVWLAVGLAAAQNVGPNPDSSGETPNEGAVQEQNQAGDLDRDRFSRDFDSASVSQVIQQDVQDGQTLAVRATPEFFVNGRPMPSFGYEQLKQLVEEAVAEAY